MFRLEHDGKVARLILDRPEARNSIPLEGWKQLAACAEKVSSSPAKMLLVAGRGGAFCAGADLKGFARLQASEADRIAFREDMRLALTSLSSLSIPVVALIEGPCYGAGVALAMACDLRIAATSASLAITPAKLGISYPQEDVFRLVQLVGEGQAARLLLSAKPISAEEAHRIGLVDWLDEGPDAVIAAIQANARSSLTTLKRSIRLASAHVRQDDDMDRCFDSLIAGESLARRLRDFSR